MCFGTLEEHNELIKLIENHIKTKDVIEATEKAIKLDLPVFGIQSYSSRLIRKGDLSSGTKIQENGPTMVMHIKLPNKVPHSDITDRRKILEAYLRDPNDLSKPPAITKEKILPLVKQYHDIHFYACPDEFLNIAESLDAQTLFDRCLSLDLSIFCLLLRKEELTIGVDHRDRSGIKLPKNERSSNRDRYNIFLNSTRSLCNTILGVRDPPATILREYLELVLIHDEVMGEREEERNRLFERLITETTRKHGGSKSMLSDFKWNETTFKKVRETKKRIETIRMGLCDQLAAYYHDNIDNVDPLFFELVPQGTLPISITCALKKSPDSLRQLLIKKKLETISHNLGKSLSDPIQKAFVNITSVIANSARGYIYVLFYNGSDKKALFGAFKAIDILRYKGEKCILYLLEKWNGEFKEIFSSAYRKVIPNANDGTFFFPRSGNVWNSIISDITTKYPNTEISIAYDIDNHNENFENRIEGSELEINAIRLSFKKNINKNAVAERVLLQTIQGNEKGNISEKYMFSSTTSLRNMYTMNSTSKEVEVSSEDKLALWKYVVEEVITELPKNKFEDIINIHSTFEYADPQSGTMAAMHAKLLLFYPEQIDTSYYPKFNALLKSSPASQKEFEENKKIVARITEK